MTQNRELLLPRSVGVPCFFSVFFYLDIPYCIFICFAHCFNLNWDVYCSVVLDFRQRIFPDVVHIRESTSGGPDVDLIRMPLMWIS